jgi:cobalt-zinc-cadmium efflux system membrane fusion protein
MLSVPEDVVAKLGIQTFPASKATATRSLTLAGSLALDANRLARIHTRFAGELVEISTVPVPPIEAAYADRTTYRQVQVGDKVQKDQLLAVVWCKDLGEKKSELVDALSQLRLDRERLEKLEEGYRRQAIPEASVRQSRRDVEADINAVARAERTLRVWRLNDAEIEEVKAETERISQRQGKRDQEKEKQWARVEVRAPFDGVVLERNVATGDIVDTTTDLFKVADLSRLSVWAYLYENHLPAILNLPQPTPWTVRLKSDPDAPPVPGRVELIGSIVDPTQHTVLIRGSVENPDGRLRAGQFITATIELPPLDGETVIPIGALVEDGQESIVFIQPRTDEPRYSLRRVKVVRRTQDQAYLASRLQADDERQGLKTLIPGERIVTAGAVALKATLEDLQVLRKKEPVRS